MQISDLLAHTPYLILFPIINSAIFVVKISFIPIALKIFIDVNIGHYGQGHFLRRGFIENFLSGGVKMKRINSGSYKAKAEVITWISLSIFLMCTLVYTSKPDKAQAAEKGEVKLTLLSGWTSPWLGNVKLEEFVKRVNEKGKGKVFIDYKGGAEIAPLTESPGLVRDGVFDMVHTTPGYYAGLCREAVTAYYAPSELSLLRKIGFNKIMDEVHRKRMGCSYLGMLWRGEKFTIISKKPIRSADFKGWKMHSVPIFTIALKYLGASTVALSTPEFYVAIERGVVDAIPLPMGMVPLNLKLHEVSEYILHPPIPLTTSATFLVNAKRWDGLPSDIKGLIMGTMKGMEKEVYDFYTKIMHDSEAKLIEKGMKVVELPPAEAKKYYYAFTDHTWEIFRKNMPEYGPRIYEICKPYLQR